MQRSLRRFSPGSAAAAVGTSGSLGQEMADQNCEPLFDAWMRCLVNSECFAGAEGKAGSREALKYCANPTKMSDACKLAHQNFQACKRGVFQSALDKPPAFLLGTVAPAPGDEPPPTK